MKQVKSKDSFTCLGKFKFEESEEEEESDDFKLKMGAMIEELDDSKLINRSYTLFFIILRTVLILNILFL